MKGSHWTQDSPGYFPAAQTHEWLRKRLHEIAHGEIDGALRAILNDGWRQDKDLTGMPEAAKATVAELVDTAYYALRGQPPDVEIAEDKLREALAAIYE